MLYSVVNFCFIAEWHEMKIVTMKTELHRSPSIDSYSSFTLPSPEDYSKLSQSYHSTSSVANLSLMSNLGNFSATLPNIYSKSYSEKDSLTPPHHHTHHHSGGVVSVSPSLSSSQASLITTPPLSSSPLSPSEPLRNITNNQHINHDNTNTPSPSQNINPVIKLSPTKSSQQCSPATSARPSKSQNSSPSKAQPVESKHRGPQFSPDQVDCICNVLIQSEEIERLSKFLGSLPSSYLTADGASEVILRAKVEVAFSKGNFKDVYSILQSNTFDSNYHGHLQAMWYRAHYKEAEGMRQRPLGEFSIQHQSFSIHFLLAPTKTISSKPFKTLK